MTAISPVVLPPSRINSDQPAADSANTAAPAAQTDFAGTLRGVATKPARKPAAGKDTPTPAEGGENLPQAGKGAPAPAAARPAPASDSPATVIPAKGKPPAKQPAAPVTPPVAATTALPAVPVVPLNQVPAADTKSHADLKAPAPTLPAIDAMAARSAPPPETAPQNAAPADPATAAADATAPAKTPSAPVDNSAGLFNQALSSATSTPAITSAPPAAAPATGQPVSQNGTAGIPPISAPAPPGVAAAATATPVASETAGVQAGSSAAVSGHAGKMAAVHAPSNSKATSSSGAKTRTAATSDARHSDANSAPPSEEGDGAEPHALQAASGGASPAASAVAMDVRPSSAGGTDPTPLGALVMNARAQDATPGNQDAAGVAVQDVSATSTTSGAAANAAPSTPSFANLVGASLDKHADSKADAAGAGIDPSGALPSVLQTHTDKAPDAPAAVPTFKLGPSVDSSEFGQGVASQVSMMVDSNITSAKLQISPPALGPIEVRIALQGDHATVQFTSHSALTREALADSTPKLRDMLSSQGFGQVSVDISHRSFQERPSNAQAYEWGGKSEGSKSAPSAAIASRPALRAARSGVDAYA